MTTFLALISALVLDLLLGEFRRFHPLVGFGNCASYIEKRMNRAERGQSNILSGALAWSLLVILPTAICAYLYFSFPAAQFILDVIVLYFAIGYKSLHQHISPIFNALMKGDLDSARKLTGYIVSRDTDSMDEEQVRKAALESLLENGSDAVFAPLFFFAVLGAPGVLLYRLANTLDAMWGYKNTRFLYFGRVAARCDDVLNWIPARLTALSYALLGSFSDAWQCWQTQAKHFSSPNAGPVMAAGAGSLRRELGGDAYYHGKLETRAMLGVAIPVENGDLIRGLALLRNVLILWCVCILMIV